MRWYQVNIFGVTTISRVVTLCPTMISGYEGNELRLHKVNFAKQIDDLDSVLRRVMLLSNLNVNAG